jgi:hypothetical protein
MKKYRGIIVSVSAYHFPHNRNYKNPCAKVSLWGQIVGPRGGLYDVWLGKTNDIPEYLLGSRLGILKTEQKNF